MVLECKQNTEEENRIIQILNDTLSSLVSQYEDYKRYSDTNPTIRLYRETETLILKAIKKIDQKESIDRNFWLKMPEYLKKVLSYFKNNEIPRDILISVSSALTGALIFDRILRRNEEEDD